MGKPITTVHAGKRVNRESWGSAVDAIHRSITGETGVRCRLRKIADALLGRPYAAGSLLGTPERPEKLIVDLGAFDCVTFVETALALARSGSREGFITELKRTRYREGRVGSSSRLHYFSDWMRHNEQRGAIRIRTRGLGSRSIHATLALIESLPRRRVRIDVVPKRDFHLALRRLSDGSIVAFASVRSRLDFFHTGLLFFPSASGRAIEDLLLYHAPRSAGRVIAEPLSDFLKRNRMRGLAFAEPLDCGDFK